MSDHFVTPILRNLSKNLDDKNMCWLSDLNGQLMEQYSVSCTKRSSYYITRNFTIMQGFNHFKLQFIIFWLFLLIGVFLRCLKAYGHTWIQKHSILSTQYVIKHIQVILLITFTVKFTELKMIYLPACPKSNELDSRGGGVPWRNI